VDIAITTVYLTAEIIFGHTHTNRGIVIVFI